MFYITVILASWNCVLTKVSFKMSQRVLLGCFDSSVDIAPSKVLICGGILLTLIGYEA